MSLKAEEALALSLDYTNKSLEGAGGLKGEDGFSPIIEENPNNTDDVYKLDITTATGTMTTPNLKGDTPDDYLPISGGTMDTDANIVAKVSNDNRTTTLTGSGIRLKPPTTNPAAFGLAYYDNNTPQNLIGGIGAYAQNNEVDYYYMGNWQNPLLKVSKSGEVAVASNLISTGNLLLNNYNFLAKYGNSSTKAVALKLGRIGGYDTKATIDIIGKNQFNFKESGQKYTLTLAFNSRVGGTFSVGGLLYYYGNFDGLTGNINSANKISIQLVQYNNLQNDTFCDVYLLLNEPANWSCFKINVDCLSNTTWTKDLQWITDESDIPQVDNSTSYIVATKDIAFTDSTVNRAIADKNGNDITETYAKINDAQTIPYDTGRVWFNGEPIMRQDYCVVVKQNSTEWNDGAISYSDCINGNISVTDGVLDWSAFGNYTTAPKTSDGTYDVNPVDWVKLNIDADGRFITFDVSESPADYDCIIIAGHIEFVSNGSNIPQNKITKIFE